MSEEPELPEEYQIPEPEGFQQLTDKQKWAILDKKKEMDKEIANAIKKNKQTQKPTTKKEEKQDYEHQMTGKYLLRDMPFFRLEIVAYFMLLVFGGILYYLDLREILPGASRPIVIIAVAIPIIIWFMKWFLYMPRKNRVPGMKLYKSGIVELGVYDISKGYITFGKGENAKKKWITKINKHAEASTGRPFIAFSELQGENINLLKTDKPDMRSEEFNALLEMTQAVTTKNVMKRMLRFSQPSMTNPLMILQFMNLIILVILVVKSFGFFGG